MKRLVILAVAAFVSLVTHGQLFHPLELGIEKCERVGDFFQPQMHVEGNILYVCTNRGLYSKDLFDDESVWQLAGFEGIPLQDYVRRGDEILALRYNTNGSFFLMSHDGGKTYEDVTPNLFREQQISNSVLTSLVQHPNSPNMLLVASSHMGIFQSFDFGQTWNQLTDIIPSYIGYNPSDPKIIYGSGEDGAFAPVLNVSYDGGQTWKYLHPDFPGDNCMNRVAFHPTDPNRWIAGGGSAVYTSTNNGQTWKTKSFTGDGQREALWKYVIYDSENSDIVYMAGQLNYFKVMCSKDGGTSWDIPQTNFLKNNYSKIEHVNDFKQYGGKLLIYTESDIYEMPKAELLSQSTGRTDADYIPFIEEEKKWIVSDGMGWRETPNAFLTYYFDGDTIVGGHTCKKWMCNVTANNSFYNSYGKRGAHTYLLAPIFEENKKVWYFRKGEDEPRLLYDFSGVVSDEAIHVGCFEEDYDTNCYIDCAGTDNRLGLRYVSVHDDIMLQDESLRRWFATHKGDCTGYWTAIGYRWYEGIGTMFTPELNVPHKVGEYRDILRVSVGEKIIYEHPKASEYLNQIYRPFIEEGKVWKVGKFNLAWDMWAIESHYFEGDTIVGGYPCKKMMEAYDLLSTGDHTESYVGAIYEDGRRVYCAWPNNDSFFLLYDFASTEGSDVSFRDYEWGDPYVGQIQSKIFRQDDKFHGWTTTFDEVYTYEDAFPVNLDWMEGVGYQGFYNFVRTDKNGYYRELLSCSVGDEVLYYDAALAAKMSPADPSEVKKNTIDFTHVVKVQPKAPRSLTPGPSPVGEGSEGSELTGEYSLKELFVNFKPLAGPYVITICDDSGTEVYRKEVQTSNVIALNTDISSYEKGDYTITVENNEEAYTANFCIDDAVGINRPTPDPSLYGGEKAGANKSPFGGLRGAFDLSGRKVGLTPNPSPVGEGRAGLPRGVYIKDGRKIVVR